MPARALFAPTLALALAAGCGHAKPAPEAIAPLDVVLLAAERLNPDPQDVSLPTFVRIYQLKGTAKLLGAESDQLYRQPKETLGEDLLQADEVLLSPGATERRRLERDRSARALAVVPLVRRPLGLTWRMAVDLPPPEKPVELTFRIVEYRVERP